MRYWDEPGVTWDDPRVLYDDPRTFQEILNLQPKPTMFDVILDISDLSIPDLITRANNIKSGTAGQAVFASLAPKLTALEGKITTLEQKQTAVAAAKAALSTATAFQETAEAELIAALNDLGSDIGKLATTETEVELANLRVKDSPQPKPVPSQPQGLALTAGDEDGELSGQCHGQPGVVEYYEIQFTTGDPNAPGTSWQFADTSKKSRFDLTGLPSGQKIWVRLRACNARGKSPWSDPASKRVP